MAAMKISKPNSALFHIALIVLFKVAGLHAFVAHNDDLDAQHCEVCHITTSVNFTPLLETDTAVIPQANYFFFEQSFNNIAPESVFNNKYLLSYRFTRPPPPFS